MLILGERDMFKIIFISAILLLLGCEEEGVESAGCEYGIEYRNRCWLWRCRTDSACDEIAELTGQDWRNSKEGDAEITSGDCIYLWAPEAKLPTGTRYIFCDQFYSQKNNAPFEENSWASTDPVTDYSNVAPKPMRIL